MIPNIDIISFGKIENEFENADCIDQVISHDVNAIVNRLVQKFIDSKSDVLSVDVFDTLLLRQNHSEARRYYDLSQKLCTYSDHFSAWDLYVCRNLAIEQSYRSCRPVLGCREGRIDEILTCLSTILGPNEFTYETLANAEIDYEVSCLRANRIILALCNRIREMGKQIILVSDMYLTTEYIAKIMSLVIGPEFFYDYLFSSANLVISKRSGRIFSAIETAINCNADQIFHIGDSIVGDYFQPKAAGWSAMHLPIPKAERVRRELDLNLFISEMLSVGQDARRWAKV